MKFAIFIVLSMPLLAMETIICDRGQNGLVCKRYTGGDYVVFNYPKSYENDERLINFHEGDGFQVMSVEDDEVAENSVGEVQESNEDIVGALESYASWVAGFNFAQEKKE